MFFFQTLLIRFQIKSRFRLDKDPFTEDERSDAREEQKRREDEQREVKTHTKREKFSTLCLCDFFQSAVDETGKAEGGEGAEL